MPRPAAALLGVCLLALVASLLPTPALAGTLRVAPVGQDVVGCGSETAPCKTIQFTVNQSSTGGTILVAGSPAGTRYSFGSTADDVCSKPFATTAVVCVVNKELVIRGGYSTSNWSVSAPAANPTIIDGQGAKRGVYVVSSGPATRLHLEGFTIENGVARGLPGRTGLDGIYGFGGGVLADASQHLVLRNLVLRNNRAIGDDVATEVGGAGSGGGVAMRWVPDAALEGLRFEANQALGGSGASRGGYGIGGGLYVFQSTVYGRALSFSGNVSAGGSSAGSGVSADGQRADALGGALTLEEGARAVLESVTATGNSATGGNATTYAGGAFGGAIKAERATTDLVDVDLRDNLALGGDAASGYLGAGGGLEAIDSRVTLTRATIVDNVARGGNGTTGDKGAAGGGGVYSTWSPGTFDATLVMTDGIVADNSAEPGRGVRETGGGGGGLWIQGTTAVLTHVTVARNTVGAPMQGPAILLLESPSGAADARPGVASIAYSIIADHTGYQAWQKSALQVKKRSGTVAPNTANLKRGLFAGNVRDTNAGSPALDVGTITGLETMLSASSAKFVAPGAPSFDYHLAADSPARDQATDSTAATDVDRQSRARAVPRDIGADESVAGASTGSLYGTVADVAGGAAPAVAVSAYDATTGAFVAKVLTDAAGKYAIGALPAGAYRVRFGENDGAPGFVGEWYADRPRAATANVVNVVASAATEVGAVLTRAPLCYGWNPTIVGTIGPDVLRGGNDRDIIVGGAGADDIAGNGGDDILCGGAGNDLVAGGLGNDYLNGGAGNDVQRGQGGNDMLRDAGGDDQLFGGPGNDDVRDTKGTNVLEGAEGVDTCNARAGNTLKLCEIQP